MEVAANDSSKKMISTPVKCTSADQERKKTMHKNLDDDGKKCTSYLDHNVKDALCSTAKKRKKEIHKNLDDNVKDELRSSDKKRNM